ncbi:MAG TPA: Hpt domain-containing protein [Burkholderiaceae bacterium]|nr:Hpt domain-containing protein [Burkholderiaceae bacterium]
MGNAIDLSVFRELQDTAGADFVTELVDTFFEEAPGMLAALRSARTAGQADAFRRAAHSLKSNSLTFGATALAAQARALELGGLREDVAGDNAAIDALEQCFADAAAALRELRNG